MEHKEILKCGGCGNDVEFTYYDSINARQNPELKQKLLDGSLYEVSCPHCGAHLRETYSQLYHDPDKKFMVYGVHPDSFYKVVQTYDIMREKNPQMHKNYRLRIVSSPTRLREKVAVLNADLDDRVIEIYKYLDVESIKAVEPEANATKAYFYIEDGKNMLEFDTNYPLSKQISADNYDFIKSMYFEEIELSADNYIIDSEWAESIFNGEFDSGEVVEPEIEPIDPSIYDFDDDDETQDANATDTTSIDDDLEDIS